MRRIFYVSEIDPATSPVDIRAIVSSSTIWNRRRDVTGLLVASLGNFSQVLEGRDEHMDELMDRIRRDTHHHAVEVQLDESVTQRLFGRWSMLYVQRDDLSDELHRLHSFSERTLQNSLIQEFVHASNDLVGEL